MSIRVLVLTPYEEVEEFKQSGPSLVMTWGMDSRRIEWVLHNPARKRADLSEFDAVLSWPYGLREKGFFRNSKEFEQVCMDAGIPVVNSFRAYNTRHSRALYLWRKNNIPCASYQHIKSFEDITFDYPLILRTDGVHRGRNMYLCFNPSEARAVIERSHAETEFPPVDLAIQFIETVSPDGYYRKWRSHVIGDRIVPRQMSLSRNWMIHLDASSWSALAIEEDRKFIAEGESQAELVIRAAKVLGSDIIALDYSKLRDGSYIFWEGNRNYDLSVGGEMWKQFQNSTGRTDSQCMESLMRIGEAIADLVIERASEKKGSAPAPLETEPLHTSA